MDYLAAIKKPWENLELYLTLSLLSFIPVANIYVLGYLLDFCSRKNYEARKMVRRFVSGSKFFALLVIYFFPVFLAWYLFSLKVAFFIFFLILPPLLLSVKKLSEEGLEKALELEVIWKAYSPRFIREGAKMMAVMVFSLMIQLMIPVIGWMGIIYAPLASLMYMLGSLEVD